MKYRVNLLSSKQKTLMDRGVYFALNYLRYILVITQIVVIGVFFYRFQIDQEIVDLKEEIQQKQEIVFVSNPLIEEAKAIDNKVGIIDGLVKEQDKLLDTLNYLFSRFPEQIKLDNLRISQNASIDFSGRSNDSRIIKIFYTRLLKEAKFSTVDLATLEKKSNEFHFNMKLDGFK
jgi:hypothetical protein